MADNGLSIGIKIGAAVAPSVGKAFGSIEERSQKLGRTLRETWSKRDTAGNVIHYRNTLQQLKQKQAQLGYSSERLNRGIEEVEQKYREAKSQAKEYGMSVANIDREHRQMADSAAVAERRLGRLQTMQANREKRDQLQGQVMGTMGTALAAAVPIRQAIQFESKMSDIRKVVDFEKPEQFEAMGQDILKMAGNMPMAAGGIADIVAAAGQSGIAREQLTSFAQSAVKMGTAFEISGKRAGEIMAVWRTGLGMTQQQTVHLADAVNKLSNTVAAKAPAVAELTQRIGPVAQKAGLAAEKTAALGSAMMATSGAGPERASTAVKKLVSTLGKGQAATKRQSEAFQALGLEATEVSRRMQEDAQGTITEVFERIRGLSKHRQLSVIGQLFGEEGKAAIAPLIGQLGKLEETFAAVGDKSQYAGSMQSEYEKKSQETAAQLSKLAGKANRLGVTLGSTLLPAVNKVAGAIGSTLTPIADMADEYPRATQVVVGATAGLAAFKVVSLGAKYATTVLSDGVQIGKAAFDLLRPSTIRATVSLWRYRASVVGSAVASKTAAGWAGAKALGASFVSLATRAIPAVIGGLRTMTVALMTNPIGAVVGGIALAAGLIYRYWEPISGFFIRLWSGVGRVFSGAWQTLKTVVAWSPLGLLAKAWEPVTEWFGAFWQGIKSVFSGAYEWIKKVLLSPIKSVTNQIGKAWNTVKGWFGGGEEEKTVKVREKLEKAREGAGKVGKTAAAATAAGAAASAPAAAAPQAVPATQAAQPAPQGGTTITNHFEIHAAPGMDTEELAEEVVSYFEQKNHRVMVDG